MSQEQLIDLAIMIFAGLFGLLGLLFVLQGLFGGGRQSMYGVGRQRARREAVGRLIQGVGMLVVSALLFGALRFVQQRSVEPAIEAQPTLMIQALPTPEPATATEVLPTAVPATSIPEPTATTVPEPATVAPEPVSEEAETADSADPQTETDAAAEPTAEIVPTEVPTEAPTKPPYDAAVNVVGGLYLRDSPNGNVMVLLEDGAGLFLLDDEPVRDGAFVWQPVRTLDGEDGWVAASLLVVFDE